MQIQQDDKKQKLTQLASSIERDPYSWQGWSALHIEMFDALPRDCELAITAAELVIEAYLRGTEGHSYSLDKEHIFVLCKDAPAYVLDQVCEQLAKVAFEKHGVSFRYQAYYDLAISGSNFAEIVFNRVSHPLVRTFCAHRLRKQEQAYSRRRHESGKPIKVMLVEDDDVTRHMLDVSIKSDCQVMAVDSANRLFSAYSSYRPDIVFLDIGLPDRDGRNVLDWILHHDPGACVVMLSGQNNAENIAGCIDEGAKGFVRKPFAKENLMHYIEKYS